MRIPMGPRNWFDDQLDRNIGMMGMPGMPANYQDDGGIWKDIDLTWEQVAADRWRVITGNHRAWIDSGLGLLVDFKDASNTHHQLGFRPRWLVKFRTSDQTWSVLATATSPIMTFAGGIARAEDIFPGIHCEFDYFNVSVGASFLFTQDSRDALVGMGPWSGYWLGIVSELDPSNLNLNWRDINGDFTIDTTGRMTDGWVECHSGGVPVLFLQTSQLRHELDDAINDQGIPVYKFIVIKSGIPYLIELFDPTLTVDMPSGTLIHNATFGNGSEGSSTTGTRNFCLSLLASPLTSGDLTDIQVYGNITVGTLDTTYSALALYTDASPPQGSGAAVTEERVDTIPVALQWLNYALDTPVPITASTNYNLAAWSGGVSTTSKLNVRSESSGGTCKYSSSTYNYSTWPNLSSGPNALLMSIIGIYTESAAGPALRQKMLTGIGL